jgi:HEAT repeat protein
LDSSDPEERRQAAYHLAEIGAPAVPSLLKLLGTADPALRKTAALVLGDIGDPSSLPELINHLDDNALEVRWRAADRLIEMKRESLAPIFRELLKETRFGSEWFLEGVHHVLRTLDEEGYLAPPSQRVLRAFRDSMIKTAVPVAAEQALETLEKSR